jgi:hypothetical protein
MHNIRMTRFSKQELAKRNSKWVTQRPNTAEETAKRDQQRRDLWQAINQYVTERGGFVVSVQYVSPVRIEVSPDSELPSKLRELGYDPVFCQQETRIGPPLSTWYGWRGNFNGAYSFHVRDVYELRLPK